MKRLFANFIIRTSREIHLRVGSKREGSGGFAFCVRMRPNPRDSSQERIFIECSACIINCKRNKNKCEQREREREKEKEKEKERLSMTVCDKVFFTS
jgi:hypothetical protein